MDREATVIPPIVIHDDLPAAFGPGSRSLSRLREEAALLAQGDARPAAGYTREHLALLALLMTASMKDLLECIGRHPLLSEPELALTLGTPRKATSAAIEALLALGLVELAPTPRSAGWRFCLSATGLGVLAARDGVPWQAYARYGHLVAALNGPECPRRLDVLLSQFEHTSGTNSFFAFCLANRVTSAPKLVRWLNPSESAISLGSERSRRYVRPDGTGELECGGSHYEFFLEWDCGTEGTKALQAKLVRYAAYYRRRGDFAGPMILFVTPTPRREDFLWRAITAFSRRPGAIQLPVLTTSRTYLGNLGPFGPIWRSAAGHGRARWPPRSGKPDL